MSANLSESNSSSNSYSQDGQIRDLEAKLRSAEEKLEKAKEGLRFIQTIGKNADGLFYYGKEDPDLEGVKKIAKQTLAEIGEKE